MKSILGFTFFLLFLAGFAFVTLKGARQMTPEGDATLAALTADAWRPVSFGADAVDAETEMFVRFDREGGLVGHAGCNRFFGSYEFTDGQLVIGPLGMTKMMCHEPAMRMESAFVAALERTRRFTVVLRGLTMQDGEGRVVAQFAATESQTDD